ncbi:hypothetical protein HAX54_038642, partial [Datura stramonium]|nr:hypothetical protein [Datura stramonium]
KFVAVAVTEEEKKKEFDAAEITSVVVSLDTGNGRIRGKTKESIAAETTAAATPAETLATAETMKEEPPAPAGTGSG